MMSCTREPLSEGLDRLFVDIASYEGGHCCGHASGRSQFLLLAFPDTAVASDLRKLFGHARAWHCDFF